MNSRVLQLVKHTCALLLAQEFLELSWIIVLEELLLLLRELLGLLTDSHFTSLLEHDSLLQQCHQSVP